MRNPAERRGLKLSVMIAIMKGEEQMNTVEITTPQSSHQVLEEAN